MRSGSLEVKEEEGTGRLLGGQPPYGAARIRGDPPALLSTVVGRRGPETPALRLC